MNETKLDYNKKIIGKEVYVMQEEGFFGVVVDLIGEDEFLVKDKKYGSLERVSIFDIRGID